VKATGIIPDNTKEAWENDGRRTQGNRKETINKCPFLAVHTCEIKTPRALGRPQVDVKPRGWPIRKRSPKQPEGKDQAEENEQNDHGDGTASNTQATQSGSAKTKKKKSYRVREGTKIIRQAGIAGSISEKNLIGNLQKLKRGGKKTPATGAC